MNINEISYKIRGAIFTVFNELGPGLLEHVYETTLAYELKKTGLNVQSQVALPVIYQEVKLELGYRIDLLIENQIIVEIKSVEFLHDVHKKQLLTYLRLSGKKLGILVISMQINLLIRKVLSVLLIDPLTNLYFSKEKDLCKSE